LMALGSWHFVWKLTAASRRCAATSDGRKAGPGSDGMSKRSTYSFGGSKGGWGSKQLRLKSHGPERFSPMNSMARSVHQVV